MQTVNIERYERVVDDEGNFTGMLRYVGNRKAIEVYTDLVAALGTMHDDCEYSALGHTLRDEGMVEVPRYRRIAVFPVKGANEGHYVHVDLYVWNPDLAQTIVVPLMLVKTFMGMDHARAIANRLADALEV
jgi:hypothetical protein